jgi:hypothetical protein
MNKAERFDLECLMLFRAAQETGRKAGFACVPTPVSFGIAADLTGNEMVPGSEVVDMEGVCGCAWVVVRPGRCKFANWLKRNKLGSYDSHRKGVLISPKDFGQSLDRKRAWATAFAEVLNDAGINAGVSEYMT